MSVYMTYPKVVCISLQLCLKMKFQPMTYKSRAQENPGHEIRANIILNAHFITSSVPREDTKISNEHKCVQFHNAGKLEIALI